MQEISAGWACLASMCTEALSFSEATDTPQGPTVCLAQEWGGGSARALGEGEGKALTPGAYSWWRWTKDEGANQRRRGCKWVTATKMVWACYLNRGSGRASLRGP